MAAGAAGVVVAGHQDGSQLSPPMAHHSTLSTRIPIPSAVATWTSNCAPRDFSQPCRVATLSQRSKHGQEILAEVVGPRLAVTFAEFVG